MDGCIQPASGEMRLLECIIGTVHQGITVFDKDFRLTVWNETARRLLDMPVELISARPTLEDLFRFNAGRGDYGPGDPDEQVRERMARARLKVEHDFERQRPDGTIVRIQGTPMEDGGFVTVYTDVTAERRQETELVRARKALEERLAERSQEIEANRDLLLNAINAVEDGLAISDSDGRVVLANRKMHEIYPRLAVLIKSGACVSDIIRSVFPDEDDLSVEGLAKANGAWAERKFPNGKWYRVTRSHTPDGGIIAVYSEITSYKKQHTVLQRHTDELVKLLRQEKEVTEMQREFVSMASHEFRTPLAIIDSNAQRLIRRADSLAPDQLREKVENIRDAVERMQYLITRFLDFSHAQSTGMELDLSDRSLKDLVGLVCRHYDQMCKTHTIHLDIDGLPGSARFDARLIEQCIQNVLSNAIKYSPGKRDVYVTGTVQAGKAVISVRDEGLGIPEGERRKIFNRYFRASTSSGIAGTGIGLNMTEMIVRKHGGTIEAESKVGEGTTIIITLPVDGATGRLASAGRGALREAV